MSPVSLSGFETTGPWLKGNLHCHSNRSDGTQTPTEVARAYADRGYDFLAISDHYEQRWGWTLTEPGDVETDLVLLRSAELSSAHWVDPFPTSDPDVYWVTAVGLPEKFDARPPDCDPIEAAHRLGAFVGLLHPQLSRLPPERATNLPHVHAVEIYDYSSVWYDDRPDGWPTCEAMLAAGRTVTGFASDDNHFLEPWDGFGGWIQLRSQPEPGAIVEALKNGHYYSTQGPLIHEIETSGNQMVVTADPARAFLAQGADWRHTQQQWASTTRTTATFDVARFAGSYVRFTVIDETGRRAWTNPHWVSKR